MSPTGFHRHVSEIAGLIRILWFYVQPNFLNSVNKYTGVHDVLDAWNVHKVIVMIAV